MKRLFTVLALALPTLLAGMTRVAAMELPPVVVSATRSAQSSVTIPAAMTIITREEIEASGARHVVELLRSKAGLQVSDLFGDGSSVTVGMRGFFESANANTLVLVDGRRLNNPDISSPDFDSIPLADIEQIEIINGSAGSLYGDQAVGGVINIITRTAGRFRLRAGVTAGSYGRRQAEGSIAHRLANGVSYRLSGETRRSDNYRHNNRLQIQIMGGRLGYEHDRGMLFAEFQHIDDHLQTPGALTREELRFSRRQFLPVYADDFFSTDTMVLRAGIRQMIDDSWTLEAELTSRKSDGDFRQSFRTFKADPAIQDRDVREMTPRLIADLETPLGEAAVTFGADLSVADYYLSSQIGDQGNEQEKRAVYGQGVFEIGTATSLTLGFRQAWVENFIVADFPAAFSSGVEFDDSHSVVEVGLEYRPVERMRLFVRRDENFRFAKVDELTDTPAGVVLETQTGVSWEAGAGWEGDRGRASLVIYRLDLDNEIAAIPGAGAFGVPANINLPATRRDGIHFSGNYQATDRLGMTLDYSYIDGRFRDGPLQGNRIPFVAKHAADLAIEYQPLQGLFLRGGVEWNSDRVFSGDFDKVLGELPGYAVASAGASYRRKGWFVSARVNNLLDKEYSDAGLRFTDFSTFPGIEKAAFYPAPERNFSLTLGHEFD